MRLCVIGCGNVGSIIAEAKREGLIKAELKYFDRNVDKCEALGEPYAESFDEFLEGCDVVVEAASPNAVEEYGERVLRRADMVVLSVGALMDDDLLKRLLRVAEESGTRVYVPSGAVGGLDAIKAMRLAGIEEVVVTTIKNPKALGVDVKERTVLFEGSAKEAVKKFPFNVNVVAAVSLAAGTPAKVRVVADPSVERNTHIIEVTSKASKMKVVVENVPSPKNPKTSYLAALSVIELIREMEERLRVGT